jgi:hypothetical protein
VAHGTVASAARPAAYVNDRRLGMYGKS